MGDASEEGVGEREGEGEWVNAGECDCGEWGKMWRGGGVVDIVATGE